MSAVDIKTFIESISRQGSVSLSNTYDVHFQFPSEAAYLQSALSKYSEGSAETSMLKLLCDEAQLPNVGTSTGNITGRYTGSGTASYAHTKVYNEFQLGWMLDAKAYPLKFLTAWHDFIFNDVSNTITDKDGNVVNIFTDLLLSSQSLETHRGQIKPKKKNRATKVLFPDQYQCDIIITKTEKTVKSEGARLDRPSISYFMERCYPIAIDAVPLSYGSSQITKVTAQFQYSRHHTFFNDTKVTSD